MVDLTGRNDGDSEGRHEKERPNDMPFSLQKYLSGCTCFFLHVKKNVVNTKFQVGPRMNVHGVAQPLSSGGASSSRFLCGASLAAFRFCQRHFPRFAEMSLRVVCAPRSRVVEFRL